MKDLCILLAFNEGSLCFGNMGTAKQTKGTEGVVSFVLLDHSQQFFFNCLENSKKVDGLLFLCPTLLMLKIIN